MKVYIRANSPHGLAIAARAGRHWPTGVTKEVEIVDGDVEPEIEVELPGQTEKVKQPDPDRITKKSLALIKADPRFSVLENAKGEEDLAAANAEITRLRRRLAEFEGEHPDKEKAHQAHHGDDDKGSPPRKR